MYCEHAEDELRTEAAGRLEAGHWNYFVWPSSYLVHRGRHDQQTWCRVKKYNRSNGVESSNCCTCPLNEPLASQQSLGQENWHWWFCQAPQRLHKRWGHLWRGTFQQDWSQTTDCSQHAETNSDRTGKTFSSEVSTEGTFKVMYEGWRRTHVGLPQILRWYHCLQLVKYFLSVPFSCCMAQTLGLQKRREEKRSDTRLKKTNKKLRCDHHLHSSFTSIWSHHTLIFLLKKHWVHLWSHSSERSKVD